MSGEAHIPCICMINFKSLIVVNEQKSMGAVSTLSYALSDEGHAMRNSLFLATIFVVAYTISAIAQTPEKSISLKSGESADVGTAYFVVNCRSILKGDPTLDVMESPPDVSVTLRKEKIVPRNLNCSKPVEGGTLVVAAPKEVKARTEGRLTIRVNYVTLDGKRQSTREWNLILFP